MVDVRAAAWPEDIDRVRELFEEYSAAIAVDLCFQGFAEELATLPGKYAAPDGGLWLAWAADALAGCVALRPISRDVAEMKRLYVRPLNRGDGAGRVLAQAAIATARARGYRALVLDTLATMATAQALYLRLGFRERDAYYANPHPGTRYFELTL